jgi:hypothetical protein
LIKVLRNITQSKSALGFLLGLCLYGSEAIQSVALIPLYKSILGDKNTLLWVTLTTALGLVSFAYSGYYQPMIRELSVHFESGIEKIIPKNFNRLVFNNNLLGYLILLIAEVGFFLFLLLKLNPDNVSILAILFYMSSLFLKLISFNNFIVLNGLRIVGEDKKILFYGSIMGLFLSIVLVYGTGSIIGLGISSVISSFFTAWKSTSTRKKYLIEYSEISDSKIILKCEEKRMLLLLNLGGYIKLNTDIIVGSSSMIGTSSLDYAFWMKIFYMLLSLLSLWTQIRFPFWSSKQNNSNTILREINIGMFIYLLFCLVIVLSYVILKYLNLNYLDGFLDLSIIYIFLMASTIFFAGYTYAIDQFLMAKKCYAYIMQAIFVSFLAPLFAFFLGTKLGADHFIFGYLIVHVILLIIDFFRLQKLNSIFDENLVLVK